MHHGFINHFQNEITKSWMLGSGKTIPKKNKKSSVFKIRLFVYKCVWCDWTMSANWFSATMLSIGLKKITLMLMFAKLSCSIYLAIRTRNQHHPYYHVKKALYFGTYHDATVHVSDKSSEPLKHAKLTCWTYSVLKMKHVKYHLVLLYYCVKIEKKNHSMKVHDFLFSIILLLKL